MTRDSLGPVGRDMIGHAPTVAELEDIFRTAPASFKRRGDYIETFTGIAFYPLDPLPEEIDIRDIAHSLAMQCRFTGHTKSFYSVAQHSVNVATLLQEDGYDKKHVLAGLLHDASEAYLTDIARPVKPYLINYHEIEAEVQAMIYRKYGLEGVDPYHVKKYDDICLHIEGRALMPNRTGWAREETRDIDLSCYMPAVMERIFLATFEEWMTEGKAE